MYVLFDLEWDPTDDALRTPTQIAALRTDAAWQPCGEFCSLVRPEDPAHVKWNLVAYSGSSPEEFEAGPTEEDCFRRFFQWLAPDDILCCWHCGNGEMLARLFDRWVGGKLPWKWYAANEPVYALLAQKGMKGQGSLYRCAGRRGLPLPKPQHCSRNDVSVLQSLLSALHLPTDALTAPQLPKPPKPPKKEPKPPDLTRRELNAQQLAQTPYHYIYLPHSQVFHRRDCKLVLNAREFRGCTLYRTAAKKRRPCKVCRPVPIYTAEQALANLEKARKQALKLEENRRQQQYRNEVIRARMLGGQTISIRRKLLVGCCHYHLHPGMLNQKLMEQHDCLNKKCRHFEKYEYASYWLAQAEKAAAFRKAHGMKPLKKPSAVDEAALLKRFQSYADTVGYPLKLVRVQQEKPNVFKIFYVSENAYRDGNDFPNFLSLIREKHPQYRILMRHIQDLDGHCVTIEEYARIKR